MGDVTKAGRRGFARMRDDEVEEEGNEGEIKNEADGRGWFCTFVEREREREREREGELRVESRGEQLRLTDEPVK